MRVFTSGTGSLDGLSIDNRRTFKTQNQHYWQSMCTYTKNLLSMLHKVQIEIEMEIDIQLKTN